ncbi:hypothetical protein ACIQAC_17805 [Streptomyces sp. NPDC088387]|uniref:hypothetical protein n=1 Tax=Streptomyces sp. NPDC088387 TaxID=3365859 RepID=UPI00382EA890
MCPLSPDAGAGVVIDRQAGEAHVVVCAPDAWVEIGAVVEEAPAAVSAAEPAPVAPSAVASAAPSRAPAPVPSSPAPVSSWPKPRVTADVPAPGGSVAAPLPGPPRAVEERVVARVAAPPEAFRWVPRYRYRGAAGARAVPGDLSVVTTTTVVTTPAILAAVALRPGSRRRRA